MKRVAFVSFGVASVLCAALGASFWLTPNWNVRRVAEIRASPEQIYRFVGDFDQWKRWAQFREDENPKVRLKRIEVDGHPVQQVLIDGRERTRIRMDYAATDLVRVSVEHPFPSRQTFRAIAIDESTTRLIWTDEGTVSTPLVGGLLAYTLAERLGEHHDSALRKLRALAESTATQAPSLP